ncbi:MAG: SDR family oxidoreductase [candidate division WOR-3 bacterium]
MQKGLLEGKVAFITGGYRGIGSSFARAYLKERANVVICGRNFDKIEEVVKKWSEEFSVKVRGIKADVRNKEEVKEAVKYVLEEFGKIDILVNCAGVAGVQKPFYEITEEEFNYVFETNFKGALFMSQEVAKHMIKQRSGKIINVASIAGKLAMKYMAPYSVSKAALIHLTKVMAIELINYNIQVNVVCPGYFLTDMNREFFETEKGKEYIGRFIPAKRIGSIEEIESTAIYLATCPSYLTGCEIVIDGGQSLI